MEFAVVATRELMVSPDRRSMPKNGSSRRSTSSIWSAASSSCAAKAATMWAFAPGTTTRRPSLQVNPERQSFKCWVCDIGGDVFSFVMKMEGVEFPEALAMLADRAGIVWSSRSGRSLASRTKPAHPPPAAAIDKRTLYKAMAWAEQQYHHCLLELARGRAGADVSAGARHHGREHRTISPWLFAAGSRLDSASQAARQPGSPGKCWKRIGVMARPAERRRSLRPLSSGRVLFSIRDAQGRPVGIGGRVLPELGRQPGQVRQFARNAAVLQEQAALWPGPGPRGHSQDPHGDGDGRLHRLHRRPSVGFTNAVAVLGTALGESHVRIFKRFADRIVLVLDGDEAGQRRANEVLELFVAEQADLRILTLPDELDPCDFLHKHGAEAFRELLDNQAVDALDHAFEVATRGIDLERDIHGASQAIERLLGIVAKAPRLQRRHHGATTGCTSKKFLQRLAARSASTRQKLRRRLTAVATSRRTAAAGSAARRRVRRLRLRSRRNGRSVGSANCWNCGSPIPSIGRSSRADHARAVRRAPRAGEIYEIVLPTGRRGH